MGMRIIGRNKKLRELKDILAPLTWHSEHDQFGSWKFKAHETRPEVIIGYWAEDGSPYEITCPPQLRNAMIVGLNLLQNIYVR